MFLKGILILELMLIVPNLCRESIYPSDWIDPTDMEYYDRTTKSMNRNEVHTNTISAQTRTVNDECSCKQDNGEKAKILLYFKRSINLLLNIATLNKEDMETYDVKLTNSLSAEKYDILKQFGSNKESSDNLREVDMILSELLHRSARQNLEEIFFTWSNSVIVCLTSTPVLIMGSVFFSVFICYKLINIDFSIKRVFALLLLIMFVVAYVWTSFALIEEEEIKQMTEKMKRAEIPVHCDTKSMSLWQRLFSSGEKDECLKYFQAHHKTVWKAVPPQKVLSEMFGQTLAQSIYHLGKSTGELFVGIYDTLPFPINILALPLVVVIAPLLVLMVISFVLGVPVSINLLHLISFRFGITNIRQERPVYLNQPPAYAPLEQHRNIIEDVRRIDNEQQLPAIDNRLEGDKSSSSENSRSDVSIAEEVLPPKQISTSAPSYKSSVVQTENSTEIKENLEKGDAKIENKEMITENSTDKTYVEEQKIYLKDEKPMSTNVPSFTSSRVQTENNTEIKEDLEKGDAKIENKEMITENFTDKINKEEQKTNLKDESFKASNKHRVQRDGSGDS